MILLCSLSASFISFRNIILYSHAIFIIEDVYDALYSKKMTTYLVRFEAHVVGFVVHGDYGRGELKFNLSKQVCNYCKKRGHIKKDYYKLKNKGNLSANQKGRYFT